MTELQISDRARFLLKRIVSRYIHDGQPIGSRTLSREENIDLSSASIRNVMSDLEQMGLICSPHTSSGRIPTAKGYRFFVEQLLEVRPLTPKTLKQLQQELSADLLNRPDTALQIASAQLAELTGLAGIVMLPRWEQQVVRQIEFLPLSGDKVLVILVTNDSLVQNRIIHTSRHFSESELTEAANYFNSHFGGKHLSEVRRTVVEAMAQHRDDMDRIMRNIIEVAQSTLAEEEEQEGYLISGQTKLMGYSEMGNLDRLRQLFEAFNQKRDLLHLLEQSMQAQGIEIFIGEESGYKALDECSVVTAPYRIDGAKVGVLGVIGPTRMKYDKVIPIVDITANLLGSVLAQQH
ncbi:heat-inducible transcription repressor HrcA [Ectothiorhodospiraceae bacterium BW-2]|nr:heat-inducible transcription repressor HrcA [Ectothiorhodospiraceae bacterium BW-2]